jgi:hypothetical protein
VTERGRTKGKLVAEQLILITAQNVSEHAAFYALSRVRKEGKSTRDPHSTHADDC